MSQEPIRVLHVVGGMGLGGIQSYLMNLYRVMDRTKIQFDFLVHIKSENSFENEIHSLGGKVYYIENDYFEKKQMKKYSRFIDDFLKKHHEYKIIHGHLRSTAFIYLKYAKKHNKITIFHSHSTSNGCKFTAYITNLTQIPIRYMSDYFMGCSQAANEWLFGKKIAKSNHCYIVYNGIEVEKFTYNEQKKRAIRRELKLDNHTLILMTVGRLVEQKNQMFLIKMMEELTKKNKNVKLLLVGDGPLKELLQKTSKMLHLDEYIIFLGARVDVYNLLQAADIFLLPSKSEGLGIVAIEAQASGLPTIVSPAVPKEAHITNLCVTCSNSIEDWIKEIEKVKHISRKNMEKEITQANYNIHSISKWLADFYIQVYNKKDME